MRTQIRFVIFAVVLLVAGPCAADEGTAIFSNKFNHVKPGPVGSSPVLTPPDPEGYMWIVWFCVSECFLDNDRWPSRGDTCYIEDRPKWRWKQWFSNFMRGVSGQK